MRNIIVLLILVVSFAYAKKDFFYSFVDNDKSLISNKQKKEILDGNNKLQEIRRYMNEDQLDVALNLMDVFNRMNNISILDSDAVLLHSEILHKMGTKTKAAQADQILETAIHESKINKEHLLAAYRLLVKLKLKINKLDKAEYYAKAMEHIFDDPSSKVYGKVARSQIHIKRREYREAIRILKRELIDTGDLNVATIIADELFDAYLLNKENEKAYELVEKVLEKNLDYYANDSYRALTKVNKLIRADMPKFAIKILQSLLEKATLNESIDNFKFILANTYMLIAGYEKEYLPMAKSLYLDLIKNRDKNPYFKRSKMLLDEIIMREGKFDPQMISAKYSESESMQQKAMMQELINAMEDEKYEQIIKLKKVYSNINKSIINRFGYESLRQIYGIVNFKMVKYFLQSGQCQQLNELIVDIKDDVLLSLIEDDETTDNLFSCMLEEPLLRTYYIAKKTYSVSKNSKVYFYLERIAMMLNKYKDAFEFSQKLDMLNNGDILSQEFLYRFLIYGKKNNNSSMQKFFTYARENQEFIINNETNPLIIDFYYQYYLYLLKQDEENEAFDILNKLYEKQNKMNARVYSPFVELELAKYAKLDDKYDEALEYLKYGLNIKRKRDGKSIDRKIKKEDLAHIYYEIAKIYEYQGKQNKYKDIIKKCKSLKNVDSYYKKMCDNL